MTNKIIAFIDLGPQLTQYFVAVGERLAPDYQPAFFACHLKTRSLLHRLGQQVAPQQCGNRARDWPPEITLDLEQLRTRLRATADRVQVQTRAPAFCALVRQLADFLHTTQPAGIFLWNGSGLAAAITAQLAQARGIPLLFGENGYLPNTLQLDSAGVNARSSLGWHMDLNAIAALTYSPAQHQEFDALVADYRAGRSPAALPPARGRVRPSLLAYTRQGWRDWWQRPPARRINRRIARTLPPLPARFVLFALQVKTDSQLTLHSPLYGNQLELAIADVAQALHKIDPSVTLVVKLHPADVHKTDYDGLVAAHPAVLWIGGGDVRCLLARALGVVTVNSTVGIEALLFGTPVVTLGDNFYIREGVVYPVRERAALLAQLQRALCEPLNVELIGQYLRYLYFIGLVRAHWRDHSAASIDNLAQRLVALIKAA